ncbi:MAG TPA: cytochrome c peroxidase [Azospirillum sp.]|nr:cytochrome c peroxidase [Azospirillum sp.]
MNADLTGIMAVGTVAVLIGGGALALIVRGDLAPSGARATRSGGVAGDGARIFLGAALGFGIVAFSIKLMVMAAIAALPEHTVAPLIAGRAAAPDDESGAFAGMAGIAPRPPVWRALPDTAPAPADNPTTPEKVALGQRLFHDARLSSDGRVSCASCHDVAAGNGADGRRTALGVTGVPGPRNTPTVWNAAFQSVLFWDGRAASLEEQAAGPLLNPDEMGMPSLAAVADVVRADPSYREAFARAFGSGEGITGRTVAAAIAAYERTLVAADTPYDRFVRGDADALTPAQRRGMALFQTVGCVMCHSGPNFSGASVFPRRSPYWTFPGSGRELAERYGLLADKGRAAPGSRAGLWRVPSLRNVAVTAPYFHNGAVEDLGEAVRVMAATQLGAVVTDDSRQRTAAIWSPERAAFDTVGRRALSDQDVGDIVAFLGALTSDAVAARLARRR